MIPLAAQGTGAAPSGDLPGEAARSLLGTAVWCTHHTLRAANLRSPALDPSSAIKVPSFEEVGIATWLARKRQGYEQACQVMQRSRAELLERARLRIPSLEEAQAGGRVLLYQPMETVSDGAAEVASRGFFDLEDAPPWDTWFWCARDTVYSWVPNALLPGAQAGIDANPVECIQWAEWSALPRLLLGLTTSSPNMTHSDRPRLKRSRRWPSS